MAVALSDLREMTDEHDPGSVSLSMKGGKAKMSYWWQSTNVADFQALATLIIGQTLTDNTIAGIRRQMPICHPRFPTLYAETISDFAGMGGQFVREASAPSVAAAPSLATYARYPQYRIDVEFANRVYPLIADSNLLPPAVLTWSDDTGSGAAVPKKCWDSYEYLRWLWVTGGPKENILTAKQGQMVLDTWNGTQVFPDMPKMPMPDGVVKFTWYEVPWSFVRPTSGISWFQQYMGRVNYFQFMNWAPGELLYITIQPRPYTSPIPDAAGQPIYLADIDILCLETSRDISPADAVPAPALANWIKNGWNLQPWWYDRAFHYAHVGNIAAAPPAQVVAANMQAPTWKSFPFQILFSNPNTPLPP
jgi:hypothetical protein